MSLNEENRIAKEVVDSALRVHRSLGPGLLESVYEVALAHESGKRGFKVQRQVSIPINYDGIHFEEGFRADLLINEIVILELKSVEKIVAVHKKTTPDLLAFDWEKVGPADQFRRGTHKKRRTSDSERPLTLD